MKLVDYISYVFKGKRIFYDIEAASDYDKTIFKPKKNTILFRVIGSLKLHKSIVCINPSRNLIYFLKDYNLENSDWETRGIKLDFPLYLQS